MDSICVIILYGSQDCFTPAQSWASGGTMTTGVRKSSKAKADPERVDGRRARSRSSHTRIVEAMMELIVGGALAPSASRVAAEAGIGLRTLFRHSCAMDSLSSELTATIPERVSPLVMVPYPYQRYPEARAVGTDVGST